MPRYIVKRLSEVEEDRSTCGVRRRIVSLEDTGVMSISHLEIKDAQRHYHKKTTELYYCLEGKGYLELDEEEVELEPGTVVMIPPGIRHRAYGDVKVLVVCCPAFSPNDNIVEEEKK